jgi:hypothetical protein
LCYVGFEWRPGLVNALPGITLFGDIGFGEHNYDHALAGFRVYFGGEDKPLINRHRDDDPLPLLVNGVNQVGGPGGMREKNSTGGTGRGRNTPGGAGSGGAS